MPTRILEARSVSKSMFLIKDLTLQPLNVHSSFASNSGKSIIAECFADLVKCKGVTVAFWVKGNYTD